MHATKRNAVNIEDEFHGKKRLKLTSATPRRTFNAATSFLDLPGEIRNQVYKNVFEDMVAVPDHIAYDSLPTHSRFDWYLNLLLVNRQVSAEVDSMFRNDYLRRLVFYFEDAPSLYDFQQEAAEYHDLDEARCCLRACSERNGTDEDLVNDSVASLMENQPGILEEWCTECPMFYETWHRPGSPYGIEWIPEEDGFVRVKGDHSHCNSRKRHCIAYESLIWPVVENKTRLTAYRWLNASDKIESGSMILEGRLRDVSFENYDMHCARGRNAELDGKVYYMYPGKEPQFDIVHERVLRVRGQKKEADEFHAACYESYDEETSTSWSTEDESEVD